MPLRLLDSRSGSNLFVTPLVSLPDLDVSANHGQVLPDSADKARNNVLQRAIAQSASHLVVVRQDLSK
jgi:hypothetical protein